MGSHLPERYHFRLIKEALATVSSEHKLNRFATRADYEATCRQCNEDEAGRGIESIVSIIGDTILKPVISVSSLPVLAIASLSWISLL